MTGGPSASAPLPDVRAGKLDRALDLRPMERLHAPLGRMLTVALSPFLSDTAIQTTPALSVRSLSAAEVAERLTFGFSFGTALFFCVSVSSQLARSATTKFYGGDAAVDKPCGDAPPSTVETQIASRLSQAVAVRVAGLWRSHRADPAVTIDERMSLEPAPRAWFENDLAIVPLLAEEAAASLGCLDIIYGLDMLREAQRGGHPAPSASGRTETCTRETLLATAVGDVRVKARVVLARPQMSLDRVMRLGAGDLLPITIPAALPLLVSDRIVATGTLGSVGGISALQLASPAKKEFHQ